MTTFKTNRQIIKAAMKLLRKKVKRENCARSPEMARKAANARWHPETNGKPTVRKITEGKKA